MNELSISVSLHVPPASAKVDVDSSNVEDREIMRHATLITEQAACKPGFLSLKVRFGKSHPGTGFVESFIKIHCL